MYSKKYNISDEYVLQIVSDAIVNDSERHGNFLKEKKNTRINKIDTQDISFLNEIKTVKLEHSNELAAFRAENLQIKEAANSNKIFVNAQNHVKCSRLNI